MKDSKTVLLQDDGDIPGSGDGSGGGGGDTDLIIGGHTLVLKYKFSRFSSVKIWEN